MPLCSLPHSSPSTCRPLLLVLSLMSAACLLPPACSSHLSACLPPVCLPSACLLACRLFWACLRAACPLCCLVTCVSSCHLPLYLFLLNILKKGVGSGSICQRYGSAPKCHGSPTQVTCKGSHIMRCTWSQSPWAAKGRSCVTRVPATRATTKVTAASFRMDLRVKWKPCRSRPWMHSGRYLALSWIEKTTLSYGLKIKNKSKMLKGLYLANSFGFKTEH